MHPAIAVRDLTKIYEEGNARIPALRGVDLEVQPGELVMLVGPSGSGKTTLLSIMGCILSSTSGSIRVAGKEVDGAEAEADGEYPAGPYRLCVPGIQSLSNTHGRRKRRTDAGSEKVETAAGKKQAQLAAGAGRIRRKVQQLSRRSERRAEQRVAIARALAGDPQIVLADEPTAALDSHTGRNVMEMMRGLAHERGRAVVIVTHDSRVMDFADRTIRIEDGMIADSTLEEIKAPPGLGTYPAQASV